MQDYLTANASTLDMLQPGEKMIVALVLPRYSFEDPTGLPLQVTVEMERGQGTMEVTIKPSPDAKVAPGKLVVGQPQVPGSVKSVPVFKTSELF
jgi:hypothetical protein